MVIDIETENNNQVEEREDLAFSREDFAFGISYKKFLAGERLYDYDFKDKEQYLRYFLLSLELVDYGIIVESGEKGSGKSLFMIWLSNTLRRLFAKGVTLNFRPKEEYGDYHYLTEQSFLDEWVKLTELADRTDSNTLIKDLKRLTEYSQFYNHFIGIDEARKWASKYKSNGRILSYIGELVDLSRHNHNIICFAMPHAFDMLNRDTVLNSVTHEVNCSFNTHYVGCASYRIKHINSGKIRWMHLSAKKYSHLWESWNLIGMSRPITEKQMKDAQKRASPEMQNIERSQKINRDNL